MMSLIGENQSIKNIRNQIDRIAATRENTVIYGESGVGKDLVAQVLYRKSKYWGEPFLKFNCPAITDDELDVLISRLEKRNCQKNQPDKGSVLFIDRIGEMPLHHQNHFYKFIQNCPSMSHQPAAENKNGCWIIISTREKPYSEMDRGNNHPFPIEAEFENITIPPLRQRPEDIPNLIYSFLKKYVPASDMRYFLRRLNNKVMDKLISYSWPGNMWELQNVLRKFLISHNWDEIVDKLRNGSSVP